MAYSVSNIGAPLGTVVVADTALGSTPDQNVRGGTTTMYFVDADNTENAAATYLKLYDASSITLGTSAPTFIFEIPANTRLPIPFPQGLPFGVGFCMAAVTTAGTAGTTAPSNPFIVRITLT